MKHHSNRELFAYWNERRGARPAPTRADIEPSALRRVLGDTFVLEIGARHTLRVAGTRLCALFGRELKGEHFVALFQPGAHRALSALITAVVEEKIGVIAGATGVAADDALLPVDVELLLLPLAYDSPEEARILGALTPLATPYWLGAKAIGLLTLGTFRYIGGPVDAIALPCFKTAAGRLRRGLTVYDGGRTD